MYTSPCFYLCDSPSSNRLFRVQEMCSLAPLSRSAVGSLYFQIAVYILLTEATVVKVGIDTALSGLTDNVE